MDIFRCRDCKILVTEWRALDISKPPNCSGCGSKYLESYYPSIWRLVRTFEIFRILIDQFRWRLKYGTW